MPRWLWLVSVLVASMLGAIFGPALASAVVPGGAGSPSADESLVFVPTEPCIMFTGVQLPGADAGVASIFDMVGATGLGADPCAATAVPTSAEAVSLNVIAQSAQARGNIATGPAFENAESTVNFSNTPNMNNSNEVVIGLSADDHPGSPNAIALTVRGSLTNGFNPAVNAKGVLLGYWVPGTDLFESFDRTIVVGGSGTDLENGAALLAADAAVDAQTPSAADPWLIKVEPGNYDLGATTLSLGQGVSLQGSGIGTTHITSTITTITGTSTISDLTAETTTAVGQGLSLSGDAVVHDARVIGTNSAIFAAGSAMLDAVTMQVTDTVGDTEILILQGAAMVMNSRFLGTDGVTDGIILVLGSAQLTVVNSFIEHTTNVIGGAGTATCRAISTPATFLPTECEAGA